MDHLAFTIRCVPPKHTHQQKRTRFNGKGKPPTFFHDQKASDDTESLASLLAPYQPKEPVLGNVALSVVITWPWRKGDLSTRTKREANEAKGWVWAGGKPDLDNILKGFQDLLARMRFIENDQSVVWLKDCQKRFGAQPGISVEIEAV